MVKLPDTMAGLQACLEYYIELRRLKGFECTELDKKIDLYSKTINRLHYADSKKKSVHWIEP